MAKRSGTTGHKAAGAAREGEAAHRQQQARDEAHQAAKGVMQLSELMGEWMREAHAQGAQTLKSLQQQWLARLAADSSDPAQLSKTRARLDFAAEQWIAATNPRNFFAFNAEAVQKAIDTQGQSVQQGMKNMLSDLQKGSISMSDETAFELGKNIATTQGAVIFENALFQLIEYKPSTPRVYARPFLLIPPCINKFYILDLQPENSFIGYAVAQGHRTFVLSWRNPDMELADRTWDDYVQEAVIEAIERVREVSHADRINALGFCVGGTLLASALAVLAARGRSWVASATFLTTLMDFTHTGVLDVFIDEHFVRMREMQFANGGVLRGQELATTFSFLRPNDLVYNYVANNYLKGQTPPAFDLLYWNADSTNLPGRFYSWYLRNTYLENNLIKPRYCMIAGERVDLGEIDLPCYIYGSREDHIVPIEGAYASTQVLGGECRFVMGASGHIAGVINPPQKNRRSHWLRKDTRLPSTHAQWMEGAVEHPGSWWGDWAQWLVQHAGKQVAAPRSYAGAGLKAIEPAPGRYVRARA